MIGSSPRWSRFPIVLLVSVCAALFPPMIQAAECSADPSARNQAVASQIQAVDGGIGRIDADGTERLARPRTLIATCLSPAESGPLAFWAPGGIERTGDLWAQPMTIDSDDPIVITGMTSRTAITIRAPEIRVAGPIEGPAITLESSGRLLIDAPLAAIAGADGGRIELRAEVLLIGAPISASGDHGGRVAITSNRIVQWQPVTAIGSAGSGGLITLHAGTRYIATVDAGIDASGATGGQIDIAAGAASRLTSSSLIRAIGSSGAGGKIRLAGETVVLAAATVDASGAAGGMIAIGPGVMNAHLSAASALRADSTGGSDGGQIIIEASDRIDPAASFSARGGPDGGDGGTVSFLTPGELGSAGSVDVAAEAGQAGRLLLDPKNLTISLAGIFPHYDLINPSPNIGDGFGATVLPLATGNVVVTAPRDDTLAPDAGAVYLFDGLSGALKSTLFGSTMTDTIGEIGVTALANGNFVVRSPNWDDGPIVDAGAVTWLNGVTGLSGVVSRTNSLVGSSSQDNVGLSGVTALANGNYFVRSPLWNRGPITDAGAATWGNGLTGITGPVSVTNSLVGSSAFDSVGSRGIALANGNYVIASPSWNRGLINDAGAVTWGNGATGTTGVVTESNSLVGGSPADSIGSTLSGQGLIALPNGNYLVESDFWRNGTSFFAGAVTFGNGATGTTGVVSATNSLVGSSTNDLIGSSGIKILPNSDYLVQSPVWNRGPITDAGAVTHGSGTSGVAGFISTANSLVGASVGDQVGIFVSVLANGNYVVASPLWSRGPITGAGAATWVNGATGLTGAVSTTNSLVGSQVNDQVGFSVASLTNGNYVVASPNWSLGPIPRVGATTWADGSAGLIGVVSQTNSLVGSTPEDNIGLFGVVPLRNGNYVARSRHWDNGPIVNAGAAAFGTGATGTTGVVSITNALVGSSPDDWVGEDIFPLENGNYVVGSRFWNNGPITKTGAATWANGLTGITGTVTISNSLVGSTSGDDLGAGILSLPNGNYVIGTPSWDRGAIANAGAVTWGNGAGGTVGPATVTNSLVGSSTNDFVGAIRVISSGNYLVFSSSWDNGPITDTGAVTWGSAVTGVTGTITTTNSILGRTSDTFLMSQIGVDSANGTFLVRFLTENGGRVSAGFDNPNQLTFGRAEAFSPVVQPDFLARTLSAGTAVTVEASNDLTFGAPLAVANPGGSGGRLTGRAGRSIVVSSTIATDDGSLTLLANEPLSAGLVDSQRDQGNASIVFGPGSGVVAGSGTVTIRLGDGAGKTNREAGGITLSSISAASLVVNSVGSVIVRNGAAISADVTITTVAGLTVQSGAVLAGSGTIQGPLTILTGGQLAPGQSPGTLHIAGALTFQAGSTLAMEFGSPSDRIEVQGPVTLGGALTLSALPSFVPGALYRLIDNDGADPVSGIFTGRPEGSLLTLGGRDYRITYQGGDGNDIVLYPATTFIFVPLAPATFGGW